MKHEKSLSTAKSTMAAATHKSRQLLESNATTRGPITKALDFLAWPRSRSKSTHKEPELNLSNAKALQSTKTGNKGEVHYQRNIFRSGGGLIRDILAEKLQKDPNKTPTPSSHVSPCQRAQQRKLKPLSRNKSLDIHELIDNVERELEGNALSKHSAQQQRFLDDTFIDHVLRADSTDALRPQARHKHILFNDENTVYLIKKEQPVTQHTVGRGQTSKQTSPVAGKRSAQGGANGEVLKARLKFKRLPSEPDFYNNNYKQHHNHQELHRQLVQRRQSLCEGYYEQQSSSSMSSMGSAGSTGAGIVLERPKTDKPRKKLSFREPIVAGQPTAAAALRARRRSSPLERTSKNNDAPAGVVTMAAQNGNCDNLYNNRTKDAISCGCAVPSTGEPESQAMRIVRTVGQAFEVCHKFNLHKNSLEPNDERSDVSSELLDVEQISEHQLSDDGGAGETPKKEHMTIMPDLNHKQPQRPNHLELLPQPGLRKSPSLLRDVEDKSPSTPSSPRTEVSQLKDQLEAQATQTRQALAQLMLVREQLISETNARIEAQARTQQLLQQNRELLEHLASLGAYNEQQSAGLTSANIGMAPQLQLLLQASSNNNNLASINQQINNLGNINQQLTSLSQQLSGLNQQSQNLQNLQQQQQTPTMSQTHQTPSTPPSLATPTGLLQLNVSSNAAHTTNTLSSSPYPSMNQLQSISNQLQQLNSQQQQQQQQDTLSKDLFQVNQELLNRLQTLNLSNSAQPMSTSTSQNSFFYVNPLSCSPATPALSSSNAPSSFNFLTSPVAHIPGNLAHSPLGTLNRNSYTGSTSLNDDIRLSIEQNLNNLEEQLKAAVSNGNLAGMACGSSSTRDTSRSSSTLDSPSSPRLPSSNNNISAGSSQSNNNTQNNNNAHSSQEARFMLRVTDEAGNITNQRKLSATPSFITRSTSEKVPNRSQMMSQVQRTAWARHTTK